MTGHGTKFPRKMEHAVAALLTARNQEEAAQSVGISLKTLQRWQKEPEFERALCDARMSAFRQSMARLQQASVPAVTTLLRLMVDGGSPATVKARCAYYILDQTRKGIETEGHRKTSRRAGAGCGRLRAGTVEWRTRES